jgi:hypothetical protein
LNLLAGNTYPANYIDNVVTDQPSMLRFIEDNWDLGRIGNCSSNAIAGTLDGLFDFPGRRIGGCFWTRTPINARISNREGQRWSEGMARFAMARRAFSLLVANATVSGFAVVP